MSGSFLQNKYGRTYSRNFNQLEIMRVKIKWDPRTEALGETQDPVVVH